MARVYPPSGFAGRSLQADTCTVPAGSHWGRICISLYPDPLGFGKTPSRFSDPRSHPPESRFGVVYLGDSLEVCFLEAVLRDQRDGLIGDLPIAESELLSRQYAKIDAAKPMRMVDLRGNGSIRLGVPADVAKATDQELARVWSVAFHDHPEEPDGIIYPSRLNGRTNMAVYDRAVPKLVVRQVTPLIAAAGFADVLNDLCVSIVTPDP